MEPDDPDHGRAIRRGSERPRHAGSSLLGRSVASGSGTTFVYPSLRWSNFASAGGSLFERSAMAHDEARLRAPSDDQVAQVSVVPFDRGLARPDAETLFEDRAEGQLELSSFGVLVDSTRIGGK